MMFVIFDVFVQAVGGIRQIVWAGGIFQNLPNLYVEIQVDQSVQRTKVVKKNTAPIWEADFYLRVKSPIDRTSH
jgi:hypothetical protein